VETTANQEHKLSSLICQKEYLADPQDFWKNVLQVKNGTFWMTRDPLCLARSENGIPESKSILPTVKHGGASVRMPCCFRTHHGRIDS